MNTPTERRSPTRSRTRSFDINAPVVEIGDDDFALWYRDITEEPKKYDGKTVRFKDRSPA